LRKWFLIVALYGVGALVFRFFRNVLVICNWLQMNMLMGRMPQKPGKRAFFSIRPQGGASWGSKLAPPARFSSWSNAISHWKFEGFACICRPAPTPCPETLRAGGVIPPDVKNGHQIRVRAGDRLELLHAAEFALVGAVVVEARAIDDLDGVARADGGAANPDLAVTASANAREKFVVGNRGRRLLAEGQG
jgi:hypothetical protein